MNEFSVQRERNGIISKQRLKLAIIKRTLEVGWKVERKLWEQPQWVLIKLRPVQSMQSTRTREIMTRNEVAFSQEENEVKLL